MKKFAGVYKCRICKKSFPLCVLEEDKIINCFLTLEGVNSESVLPKLYAHHYCNEKCVGLADFVGFVDDEFVGFGNEGE